MKKRNKFLVHLLQLLNPGYGCCQKCGLPWNHCNEESIWLEEDIYCRYGIFAVCDICWDDSTLEELKQYHTTVYNRSKRDYPLSLVLKKVEEYYIFKIENTQFKIT